MDDQYGGTLYVISDQSNLYFLFWLLIVSATTSNHIHYPPQPSHSFSAYSKIECCSVQCIPVLVLSLLILLILPEICFHLHYLSCSGQRQTVCLDHFENLSHLWSQELSRGKEAALEQEREQLKNKHSQEVTLTLTKGANRCFHPKLLSDLSYLYIFCINV